jgi:hypothetical protein
MSILSSGTLAVPATEKVPVVIHFIKTSFHIVTAGLRVCAYCIHTISTFSPPKSGNVGE